jgi:alpha-L-rhamnosidase
LTDRQVLLTLCLGGWLCVLCVGADELDGYIAARSRLLVQRELTWGRHSFLYNIAYPTWPTEWHQITIKMAHLDHMATGQKAILSRQEPVLIQNTYARFQNETTGLITKPNSTFPSRDIVDWPQDSRDGFVFTGTNTVVNSYAAQTTGMLGQLGVATQGATSQRIVEAMDEFLFDHQQGRYCDGICSEVSNHTALHASIFPLAFKLVPKERVGSVIRWVRKRGMACSMYGAFPLLEAEFGVTAVDGNTTSETPDYLDFGVAATALLTSCDTGLESSAGYGSWCGMIRQNATCTMEAWNPRQKPNLSFSHPGATSALISIVEGFMGIRALEPTYKSFIVQPQPGLVASASIRVPTLRGFIEASFATLLERNYEEGRPPSLELNVSIPANTEADLCVPAVSEAEDTLLVDGVKVLAERRAGYLCATNLGAAAVPRSVRVPMR